MRRSLPRVGRRRSPRQAADAADGRPQRPLTRADADGRAVDLVATVEQLEAGYAAAREEDAQRAAVVLVDRSSAGTVQARRLTENAAHLVRLHPEPREVDALTRHDSRRGRERRSGLAGDHSVASSGHSSASGGQGGAGVTDATWTYHAPGAKRSPAVQDVCRGLSGRLLVCIPPEGVRIRGGPSG